MARIVVSDITSSGCHVTIDNLDTSWGGGNRMIRVYIKQSGYPTESDYEHHIAWRLKTNSADLMGVYWDTEQYGLEPNTTYYLSCYIRVEDTNELLTNPPLKATFKTLSDTFAFTCYANDETIQQTDISSRYADYTLNYGDGQIRKSGMSGNLTFTATPDTRCSFVRWVYRVGSTTATVQYSEDNPFVYTEEKDIFIRAEGKKDTVLPNWTCIDDDIGLLGTDSFVTQIDLGLYELRRYAVSFTYGGTAKIYTMGAIDTRGYLGTTSGWKDSGYPTAYIAEDDDSGDGSNFCITHDVSALTQYYVWVRQHAGDVAGNIRLHIEPPQKPIVGNIEKWDWNISNGNAAAEETQNAKYALDNRKTVSLFAYSVWNDIADKVKAVLDELGESWDSTYLSFNSTKMSSVDKTITAVRFNSLKLNIDSHISTEISDKAKGDKVIGSDFLTLTQCINNWIDSI